MGLSSIVALSIIGECALTYICTVNPKEVVIWITCDHTYLSCDLGWFICKSSTRSFQFNGIEIQHWKKCPNNLTTSCLGQLFVNKRGVAVAIVFWLSPWIVNTIYLKLPGHGLYSSTSPSWAWLLSKAIPWDNPACARPKVAHFFSWQVLLSYVLFPSLLECRKADAIESLTALVYKRIVIALSLCLFTLYTLFILHYRIHYRKHCTAGSTS